MLKIKAMSRKPLLALLAALLLGVAAECRQTKEDNGKTIQPAQVAQGNLYGGGSENIPKQDVVISAPAEWASLLEAMNPHGEVEFAETEIDFTQHVVIAVFEEVKGNGGWSIDITDVTEYADKIIVTVSNLKTGDLTSVITQPFHIIKIPATGKTAEFKHI
jgi:hypothetical protein